MGECSFCEQNISIYITWCRWLRGKKRAGKKICARDLVHVCACVRAFVIVCAKVNCKMARRRMWKWPWKKKRRRRNEMTRWNSKNVEFDLDGCPNSKYSWTLFDWHCARACVCGNLQTARAPFSVLFSHSFSFSCHSILRCLVCPLFDFENHCFHAEDLKMPSIMANYWKVRQTATETWLRDIKKKKSAKHWAKSEWKKEHHTEWE